MSVQKYLATYAEPESRCPVPENVHYEHVVVVPAFDEVPSCLQGLIPASNNCETVLCILVINASDDATDDELHRTRYHLQAATMDSTPLSLPGMYLSHYGGLGDVVVIDRTSPARTFLKGQGVGLARKIGLDLALAWHAQGIVKTPWLHTTDADVVLAPDYFSTAQAIGNVRDIAALTYPFWHSIEAASMAGRALEHYEESLRYYVLGLAWAGSPFAFHAIGSTMAVQAEAYALVRGVPKRQAGEDFYLLNKLAKVGRVVRPRCSAIQIRQRLSTRTPFGTGPATIKLKKELTRGQDMMVYHPACFALLREWLELLEEFATTCNMELIGQVSHPELKQALLALGAKERLAQAASQCKEPSSRRKRLHHWFDGFLTLKLIHALRDLGLHNLPWREAYDQAPFVPTPLPGQRVRFAMAERETQVLPSP